MLNRVFFWINLSLSVIGHTYLQFTRIDCDHSPQYFHNHSCTLRAINRYQTAAFMAIHIKDILRNISFNIAMYAPNSAGVYVPFFVNISENFCRYMELRKVRPFTGLLLKVIAQKSNFNHTCPYTGVIMANNLYLVKIFIPSLPLFKEPLKIVWTFYESAAYMGIVTIYIKVVESAA